MVFEERLWADDCSYYCEGWKREVWCKVN